MVLISDLVHEYPARRIDYKRADCARFAAYIVERLTGDNPIPWAYSSQKEAEAILAEHGGLVRAVSAVMGKLRPTKVLEPGDPVIYRFPGVVGLGVVDDEKRFAFILHEKGSVVRIPLGYCVGGWYKCRA